MNLTALAIEKKAVSYFGLFLLVVTGIASYFSLGQLEDPEFSIKTAVITTPYPGASPAEVERGILLAIEDAIHVTVLFNIMDRIADSLGFEIPTAEGFSRAADVLLKRGY